MSDTATSGSGVNPLCGWCGAPAVTEVITVPGRIKRQTAHVCEAHAADFERRGMMTLRLELDQKLERDRKRSQWAKAPWVRRT